MNDNEGPPPSLPEMVSELFDRMIMMEKMMSFVVAELAVTSDAARATLEDRLWQAKMRLPAPEKNGLKRRDLLAQYLLLEEFLGTVNGMLSKPLVARASPERD